MPNDKQYDKIPDNMWYLEQLQEYLNEKFLGTGSPSRTKINDKSNSKSVMRTNELQKMESMDAKLVGNTCHHRSQRGFDNQLGSAWSAAKQEARSYTGERKQLKTPDPTKTPQLNNCAGNKTTEKDDVWKGRVEP